MNILQRTQQEGMQMTSIKQNKVWFRRRRKEEALRTNRAAFRTGWAKVQFEWEHGESSADF